MQGSHKLRKSGKTWKITKKSSKHVKIMEFEKNLNNHGKIIEFWEVIKLETTNSQKTICQTHKFYVSDS